MFLPYRISSKTREAIREIKVILVQEQIFFKVLHIFFIAPFNLFRLRIYTSHGKL